MGNPAAKKNFLRVPCGLVVRELEPRRREGREGLSESGSEEKISLHDSHKEPI
jgi:hypothetical protein